MQHTKKINTKMYIVIYTIYLVENEVEPKNILKIWLHILLFQV